MILIRLCKVLLSTRQLCLVVGLFVIFWPFVPFQQRDAKNTFAVNRQENLNILYVLQSINVFSFVLTIVNTDLCSSLSLSFFYSHYFLPTSGILRKLIFYWHPYFDPSKRKMSINDIRIRESFHGSLQIYRVFRRKCNK